MKNDSFASHFNTGGLKYFSTNLPAGAEAMCCLWRPSGWGWWGTRHRAQCLVDSGHPDESPRARYISRYTLRPIWGQVHPNSRPHPNLPGSVKVLPASQIGGSGVCANVGGDDLPVPSTPHETSSGLGR